MITLQAVLARLGSSLSAVVVVEMIISNSKADDYSNFSFQFCTRWIFIIDPSAPEIWWMFLKILTSLQSLHHNSVLRDTILLSQLCSRHCSACHRRDLWCTPMWEGPTTKVCIASVWVSTQYSIPCFKLHCTIFYAWVCINCRLSSFIPKYTGKHTTGMLLNIILWVCNRCSLPASCARKI